MSHSEHDSSIQDVEDLIQKLCISKEEFAYALGVEPESIAQIDYAHSPRIQHRLQQAMTILNRVQPWAGSLSAAWTWYRSQPIPSLSGLTASELVISDRGEEVLAYLAAMAEGGYA